MQVFKALLLGSRAATQTQSCLSTTEPCFFTVGRILASTFPELWLIICRPRLIICLMHKPTVLVFFRLPWRKKQKNKKTKTLTKRSAERKSFFGLQIQVTVHHRRKAKAGSPAAITSQSRAARNKCSHALSLPLLPASWLSFPLHSPWPRQGNGSTHNQVCLPISINHGNKCPGQPDLDDFWTKALFPGYF